MNSTYVRYVCILVRVYDVQLHNQPTFYTVLGIVLVFDIVPEAASLVAFTTLSKKWLTPSAFWRPSIPTAGGGNNGIYEKNVPGTLL